MMASLHKYLTSNLMYLVDSENSTRLRELLDVFPPTSMKQGVWFKLLQIAVSINNSDVIKQLIWDFHVDNNDKRPCETPLHTAVLNNDPIFISPLLNHGADANCKDELGNTPLHLAIEHRNFDTVRALLNGGADLNTKNNCHVTPLSLAVYRGNFEIFEYILNRGPSVNLACNIDDLEEYMPIHLATVNDSNHGKRMIEYLLQRGADVNAVEKNGLTALHLSLAKGRRPIIEILLEHADINIENNSRISPLCVAAACGDFKTVSSLIKRRARVNTSCDYDDQLKSYTPLHLAARNGNKETVEILLKEGADVEGRNKDGETALHISINEGHNEAVEFLVEYGADVNLESPKWETGFTPLHQAILNNNKEMVKILISGGADINSDAWMLPIHYAALNDRGEIIKILLDNGVYVDTLDQNGKTPLNTAIIARKLQSAERILKYCPNLKCKSNNDILDTIDSYNKSEYKKVIAMIFKYGGIIKHQHVNNKLLIHTAVELGFVNIVEELLNLGASPNAVLNNDFMYSMLHIACCHHQNEVVKLLINRGADVDSRDRQGRTPLFCAIANRDTRIIELLLLNHADVNAEIKDGRTPLCVAAENTDGNIVRLLLNNGADINCDISFALCLVDDDDTDEDHHFEDYDALIDYYYDHQHQNEESREVAEILQKHIILLKTANLFVDSEYLSLVSDEWGLTVECKKEIKTMKKDKVHKDISHVTYYGLLTRNLRTVATYLKNDKIKNAIKSCNLKKKFPIYSNMLEYRINQAIKRNELFGSGPGISIFKIFSTLPYVCIDEIFSYLDHSSLQALVFAVQFVQEQKIDDKTNTSSDVTKITCDSPNKKIRLL